MARGDAWSVEEVELCVADYLDMLMLHLTGQEYSKKKHGQELMQRLNDRTEGSVGMKHQNISAVMLELGRPPLPGYPPLPNVQRMLRDVVEEQLTLRPELDGLSQLAVERPAVLAPFVSLKDAKVDPPKIKKVAETKAEYAPHFSPLQRDYLATEARNRSLGLAGEKFILAFEREFLCLRNRSDLADQVEHVSVTHGDGLGYDIRSFEPDSGEERFIEVKTTEFTAETPFYVTRNEVARSAQDAGKYQVSRVFNFRKAPKFFTLRGAIEGSCQLNPVTWKATPLGLE